VALLTDSTVCINKILLLAIARNRKNLEEHGCIGSYLHELCNSGLNSMKVESGSIIYVPTLNDFIVRWFLTIGVDGPVLSNESKQHQI
jgi:hypothetical protein